jgi:fatty-acid peroxygenase
MTTDLSVGLWRHGYDELPRRRMCAEDPDAYVVRLLGQRALVVQGEDGARLFYDQAMVRHGAAPRPLAALLFGRGAVHGLDGAVHTARKRMFTGLLDRQEVGRLGACVARRLDQVVPSWAGGPRFSLFEELVRVYGAAVLDWAGTGCQGAQAEAVSRDLAAIVAGFGFRPAAHQRAWLARMRANRWAREVVGDARAGTTRPRPGSALHAVASGNGSALPLDVAAVEFLNVLRPTVAVAWLGAFAGLLVAESPQYGARLAEDARFRVAFAHEVRRLTPFVPALVARAGSDLRHHDVELAAGERVVLDVPGTNTHPDLWDQPDRFLPERFLEGTIGAYCFVPQGGGELTGHRCPGEDVTTTLLTLTLERLARISFSVHRPEIRRDRIPTLPRGGLEMEVFPRAAADVGRLAS